PYAMRSLLPAQAVSRLVALQVPGLECVGVVANQQVAAADLYLGTAYPDASRIRSRAFRVGGYGFVVDDMLKVEPRVVDQPAGQDGGQAPLNVIVGAGVVSPIGWK